VKDGDFPIGEHPLETSWALWCERKVHARQSTEDYIKNLKQIAAFNTIEGFFKHYSYLKRAADLPQDFNVALFRKGCRPMWEVSRPS
jgi:translation initiation factor 4E